MKEVISCLVELAKTACCMGECNRSKVLILAVCR